MRKRRENRCCKQEVVGGESFFFFEARRRDVVLSWRDFTVFVPGLLRTVGLWRWERKKEACLREGMKA